MILTISHPVTPTSASMPRGPIHHFHIHSPNRWIGSKLGCQNAIKKILLRYIIWVCPKIGIPPFHTPSADHFLVGKPMGLLGKPNILGVSSILVVVLSFDGTPQFDTVSHIIVDITMYIYITWIFTRTTLRCQQQLGQPISIVVGGFNPFEKYCSKWVHLPQFYG